MEVNSRGSSERRPSSGEATASLIENQEPTAAETPTHDLQNSSSPLVDVQLQGGETESRADATQPPMSGTGVATGPPPVYFPQQPQGATCGELPPPYHVAASLPTYEEAELIKAGKLDQSQVQQRDVLPGHIIGEELPADGVRASSLIHGYSRRTPAVAGVITTNYLLGGHSDDLEESSRGEGEAGLGAGSHQQLLGNDFVFFTAFLTAFLFNWIGFLLLMCFCHTIAARYGALAGFGLSLAKWTIIVKNSTDFASNENVWLWWLITAFGMLVCMRAVFQYLHIKRTWRHLSTAARERLFFFY